VILGSRRLVRAHTKRIVGHFMIVPAGNERRATAAVLQTLVAMVVGARSAPKQAKFLICVREHRKRRYCTDRIRKRSHPDTAKSPNPGWSMQRREQEKAA
jgi:hypothetical protein